MARLPNWLQGLQMCALMLFSFACEAQSDSRVTSATATDSFSYFGELVESRSTWPSSSAWGFSYERDFAPDFSGSLAYLNDGHFPGHHRDGVTAEAWLPLRLFGNKVILSLGAGPFYYYDTQSANNANSYADVHGWAWLLSVDAKWQLFGSSASTPGWFLEARFDYTNPAKTIETRSYGGGFGYRMYSDWEIGDPTVGTVEGFPTWEVGAYGWKTVVNSFTSQTSRAEELDVRREVYNVLRASIGIINEGNAQLIRRNGIEEEMWAEPSFWGGNATVGAGIGAYEAWDKYRAAPGSHLSGLVSMTISARPFAHWEWGKYVSARIIWHRVVTNYSRDTDVLIGGLNLRF
jgi:hypothetical protein